MKIIKKLLGFFNKNRPVDKNEQIMKQKAHDLAKAPPDDLMIIKDKKEDGLYNKDSP